MLILTRTACLGGEVINYKIGGNHDFYNQQKVRVDMFNEVVSGNTIKPKKSEILPWLADASDTGGVYSQSEEFRWFTINSKPNYLIMDNYSELVDKQIIHKDGWSFCGVYGDFKHEAFTSSTFIDGSLLPLDKIYDSYDNFFQFVKNKWNIPIIFIHFPTIFDHREMYINQGIAITDALNILAPKYNIQNIHADLSEIEKQDSNYYHFTKRTFKNLADKIII